MSGWQMKTMKTDYTTMTETQLTWKGTVADLLRAFLELHFGSGSYLSATPSRRSGSIENEMLIINVEAIVRNDSTAIRYFVLPLGCRISHLLLLPKDERIVEFYSIHVKTKPHCRKHESSYYR
mmetsp:Transcript_10410/g.21431  ORF Transcript_10410/g.21431 Transcript_10410/m.21431 type:complete len:123 (-) Transcript_10410:138-506(-)